MVVAGNDGKVLKRLSEWGEKAGPLPRPLEFYQRLLSIQSGVSSHISVPKLSLDREAIRRRIAEGLPLLGFDDLSVDWPLMGKTLGEIIDLLAGYPELFGKTPDDFRRLSTDLAVLKEVTRAWFEGNQLPQAAGGANDVLPELMVQAALRPFLVRHSEAWLGAVEQEQWRRGYCPICGGSPGLAFLDRECGARWLLCSRCDAEWLFQRLECPYCGNQEQNTLAYFTGDDEHYRLYVCERCHHYLKAVDLRRAESEVMLPLERFLTLDLDVQAQEKGYRPYAGPRPGGEIKAQPG